jgi:hypothetical protein
VADDDNDAIYEFTAAQLSAAIAANTTLTLANGRLVHQYTSDVVDKLAVDAYGRIWSTGFAGEGLYWWDPAQNEGGVLNPQGVTGYYQVGKFDVYGNHYVGYVWQAGFTAGDAVVYGYDLSSHLLPQPVINQQPFSESVSLWNKAQFQVSAAGDGPFTYTWMRNGHPVKDSGIILGARTRTLTLRSVTRANAGKYQVVVKNSAGRITSQVATLTIAPHGGFAHPLTP